MADLSGRTVFLSASFPSGDRGKKFEPYDPSAIADAVVAITRTVLAGDGQLLFGGHPTITPLVLMIARELGKRNRIVVFQSKWFWEQQVPEVSSIMEEGFGCIEWIDQKDSLDLSLESMRIAMLSSVRELVAAVFVGGMEGIETEYSMVKDYWRHIPCFPIKGPGGAAAELPQNACNSLGLSEILESRSYPFLAIRIVDAISKRTANLCD